MVGQTRRWEKETVKKPQKLLDMHKFIGQDQQNFRFICKFKLQRGSVELIYLVIKSDKSLW